MQKQLISVAFVLSSPYVNTRQSFVPGVTLTTGLKDGMHYATIPAHSTHPIVLIISSSINCQENSLFQVPKHSK